MRARLLLSLALVASTGCRCNGSLRHVSASLVADPASLDFGNQPIGAKATKTFTLTNIGSASVVVSGVTAQLDARGAFTPTVTPGEVPPAGRLTVSVDYLPPATGADTATAVVASNSGEVDVPLKGTGVDLCANVSCAATGQGAVAGCTGHCVAGQCVYPSGVTCMDPAGCLTGTCDGMGHCTGSCYGNGSAPCCTTPPGATCLNATTLSIVPGNGTCDGAGNCQYGGTPTTIHCDCGCAVQSNGQAACNSNWKPVVGAPQGAYSSVWVTPSNDLWVSIIGTLDAGVNPVTVWQRAGGTWSRVGAGGPTIPFAQAPNCSGPGCGMTLTGDSAGTIYGSTDCTDAACSAGGVWRSSGGTQTNDWFSPATLSCSGRTQPNVPLTPVATAGAAGYVLDNGPCGPHLVKGSAGTWSIVHYFPTFCQAPGAVWASSPSDFFVTWGCGQNGAPGSIYYWDGGTGAATVSYTLPSGEFAAAMYGSSNSDIWAVGTHRWHCTGNCAAAPGNWTQDPSQPPGFDQSLWGDGADYFAAGSCYLNLYHWAANGNPPAWTEECVAVNGTTSEPSVFSIWGDGNGNVYAATSIGLMKRE